MQNIIKSPATLADIEATPEFKAITLTRQRFWLQTYIASIIAGTADPILATQSAFAVKLGANARRLTRQLLQTKKVQAVLVRYQNWGKTDHEIFLEDVKRDLDAAKPGSAARLRLVELYGQLAFAAPTKPTKKATKGKRHA